MDYTINFDPVSFPDRAGMAGDLLGPKSRLVLKWNLETNILLFPNRAASATTETGATVLDGTIESSTNSWTEVGSATISRETSDVWISLVTARLASTNSWTANSARLVHRKETRHRRHARRNLCRASFAQQVDGQSKPFMSGEYKLVDADMAAIEPIAAKDIQAQRPATKLDAAVHGFQAQCHAPLVARKAKDRLRCRHRVRCRARRLFRALSSNRTP